MKKAKLTSINTGVLVHNFRRKVGGLMKKNFLILFFLYIIFAGSSVNSVSLKETYSGVSFIEAIVNEVEGTVEEYGYKISFTTEEMGEIECVELLDKLNIKGDIDIFKEANRYSIRFKSKEYKGYILHTNYDNTNTITLEIFEQISGLYLDNLIQKVNEAIPEVKKDVKQYLYVKCRLEHKDILSANEVIKELLIKNGGTNIETVDLGSSLSTTAYTGYYDRMKIGNRFKDLNYAICSYETGNYLIIGTPIILLSY
jgi:hypothetical protein